MSWMQRLKPVLAIDTETCLECGGGLRVVVCIEDPISAQFTVSDA
jgi:hypothetical protein